MNKLFRHFVYSALPLLVLLTLVACNPATPTDFDLQTALRTAAQSGGGRVTVPPGRHVIASVEVFSNVELYLPPGAILVGSPDSNAYDRKHPHLLWGENLENFSLTGTGTIDGSGTAFLDTTAGPGENWTIPGFRPQPFLTFAGQHLDFTGVKIINSPSHVLDITESRYVRIDGIHIENDFRSPNTDGIDIRRSTDVTISNCYISTGDDAICLKSGGGPVERIVINNCILQSDDAAIKLGTGSTTVCRDVLVSNTVIDSTRYGLSLFMTGGGRYENISFDNVTIRTGSRHFSGYPIYADNEPRQAEYGYGTIRNVNFSGIRIYTDGNVLLGGHPSKPLENLHFRDVDIFITNPVDLSTRGRKPRGNKAFRPGSGSVDYSREAATFVIAHARNVTFEDVEIVSTAGRERMKLIDVE